MKVQDAEETAPLRDGDGRSPTSVAVEPDADHPDHKEWIGKPEYLDEQGREKGLWHNCPCLSREAPTYDGKEVFSPTGPRKFNHVFGALLIITGTAMYGTYGIFGRLSREDQPPYNFAAVILLAETLKLALSGLFLLQEQGFMGALHSGLNTSLERWCLLSIPGGIYMITNNLDMYMLRFMDPATQQVLQQLKVISTAFLWRAVFQKKIGRVKILAIVILMAGSAMVAWPKDDETAKGMYVTTWGLLVMCTAVSLSAVASIFWEWIVTQGYMKDQSIHLSNMGMYYFGIKFNALMYFWEASADKEMYFVWRYMRMTIAFFDPTLVINVGNALLVEKESILTGFNDYCWILVCIYAFKGLTVSQVMKHYSNIVKLLMGGAAIVLAAGLTHATFGLEATPLFTGGLVSVLVALVLYNFG